MTNILQSLNKTITAGIILTIIVFIIMFITNDGFPFDRSFWSAIFKYIHVLSGVMWVGLLYYFNFVQIPNMAKIPDEQKPAIGKIIAPVALFWFRWAALSTIISGLIVSYLNYYTLEALSFGFLTNGAAPKSITIGMGMWLGIIMAYNVWMIIWPNQKKALGIVKATDEEKVISAKKAMLFSRTNTLLSIPMLLTMVAAQNLY